MNTITKPNRIRTLSGLIPAGIFLWMLTLNLLTPYICDDYTYMNSFLTGKPIESLLEIIPSMQMHSRTMNGRLISHGLEQVFMLFPPIIFDLINAAVFTLTLYLVHRLCFGRNHPLFLGAVFCLVWLFTPDFGQVALWQVGALNYFWSLTACVLFFTPALIRFRTGRDILTGKLSWLAFCIYGFFFGWYNEIASFVGLCMVICLIILDIWMNHSKFQPWRLLPVFCGFLGFIIMLTAPAQTANKQAAAMSISILARKILSCGFKLAGLCGPLLIAFAWLLWKGIRAKLPAKTLVVAGLFALAGICASFMPVIAPYYPRRCMCTTVLMLVMACGFLAAPMFHRKSIKAACCILTALALVAGIWGFGDIASCFAQHRQREELIAASIAEGDLDVEANVVLPKTPYSGFWNLRDLMDDPTTWPNHDMARYYGLDSIICE